MALMEIHFFSNTLGREVAVNAVIPQGCDRCKTLYLLHGLSDDHTAWQRYTRVEQFASSEGLALVMPNCDRSFYTDMFLGDAYFTYITEELPAVMRCFFAGMSGKKEDNFIAGLSMGGYGAFKAALACPDRYAAACSLSGALDIALLRDSGSVGAEDFFYRIFGKKEDFAGSVNDLFSQLEKDVKEGKALPELYMSCGTEDYILPCSRRFFEKCKELNVAVDYTEAPGNHSWTFWNERIQPFIKRIAGPKQN